MAARYISVDKAGNAASKASKAMVFFIVITISVSGKSEKEALCKERRSHKNGCKPKAVGIRLQGKTNSAGAIVSSLCMAGESYL